MPRYLLLSTLTDKGAEKVKIKPERIKEVNKEIEEKFGVKIIDQYAALGQYDFITIVEAKNNETILKLSVELISRGSIKIMTLPLISIDEFIKLVKQTE